MNWPKVSEIPAVQEHYERCREQGTSHSLAEMFALALPPMSNTDREFLEGRGGCYEQFKGNPLAAHYYARVAKQAGFDTTGKVYLSGLARYPGDPQAWVSGRGDAQRVCEQRGWGCEGSVNVKMTRVSEVTGGGLAADLVQEKVEAKLAAYPGADAQEVREKVIQESAPHWAKREV